MEGYIVRCEERERELGGEESVFGCVQVQYRYLS